MPRETVHVSTQVLCTPLARFTAKGRIRTEFVPLTQFSTKVRIHSIHTVFHQGQNSFHSHSLTRMMDFALLSLSQSMPGLIIYITLAYCLTTVSELPFLTYISLLVTLDQRRVVLREVLAGTEITAEVTLCFAPSQPLRLYYIRATRRTVCVWGGGGGEGGRQMGTAPKATLSPSE